MELLCAVRAVAVVLLRALAAVPAIDERACSLVPLLCLHDATRQILIAEFRAPGFGCQTRLAGRIQYAGFERLLLLGWRNAGEDLLPAILCEQVAFRDALGDLLLRSLECNLLLCAGGDRRRRAIGILTAACQCECNADCNSENKFSHDVGLLSHRSSEFGEQCGVHCSDQFYLVLVLFANEIPPALHSDLTGALGAAFLPAVFATDDVVLSVPLSPDWFARVSRVKPNGFTRCHRHFRRRKTSAIVIPSAMPEK